MSSSSTIPVFNAVKPQETEQPNYQLLHCPENAVIQILLHTNPEVWLNATAVCQTLRRLGLHVISQNPSTELLFLAAQRGHLAAVQALLSSGSVDANAVVVVDGRMESQTALEQVNIKSPNCTAICDLLVQHMGDINNLVPETGATILYKVCMRGLAPIAEALLKAGADPNQRRYRSPSGDTPLMAAAGSSGNLALWRLLKAHGADVGAILGTPKNETMVHLAASKGNAEMLDWLLDECGLDVHAVDRDGKNTMHYAVGFYRDDDFETWCNPVLERLVKEVVDFDKRDRENRSPLELAATHQEQSALYLIEAGATGTDVDEAGLTLLHHAAFAGHAKLSKVLIEKGVEVDARDPGGTTALHLAAAEGRKEVVTILLEAGADALAEDGEGYTPRMHMEELMDDWDLSTMLKEAEEKAREKRTPGLFDGM